MTVQLEGATPTAYEIFESIEAIVHSYGAKQMQRLAGSSDMDDHELRETRARCQAARALLGQLRSGLGYTVDE